MEAWGRPIEVRGWPMKVRDGAGLAQCLSMKVTKAGPVDESEGLGWPGPVDKGEGFGRAGRAQGQSIKVRDLGGQAGLGQVAKAR